MVAAQRNLMHIRMCEHEMIELSAIKTHKEEEEEEMAQWKFIAS